MSEDPTNYTGFDSTRFARVGKAPADAIEIISGSAVASSYMPYFVDTTDSYANQLGMAVSFHHVPSEQNIYFKAFITAFTETYSSDWNEEVVYGRADPIVLFKNTSRRVSITLNIPASAESEAFENLNKVGDLAKFLYPVYTNANDATTISQSPLCRLKIMNILMNQESNNSLSFANFRNNGLNWGGAGILGAITSLSVNHNLDNPETGVIESGTGVILPKLIEIAIDFLVIHEHPLGWEPDDGQLKFKTKAFPYGTDAAGSTAVFRPSDEQVISNPIGQALAQAQSEYNEGPEAALDEEVRSLVYDDQSWGSNEANQSNFRARVGNALSGIGSRIQRGATNVGLYAAFSTAGARAAIGSVEIGGRSIDDRRESRSESRRIESAQDSFLDLGDESSNSILD